MGKFEAEERAVWRGTSPHSSHTYTRSASSSIEHRMEIVEKVQKGKSLERERERERENERF